MIYDITKPTAPALPTLGKGTECIKLLLSQASKDMQEPHFPMFFPSFGAHTNDAEFHQTEGIVRHNGLFCGRTRRFVRYFLQLISRLKNRFCQYK